MSKMKRVLALILILTMSPFSTFASTDSPEIPTYKADRNAQVWSVEYANATTGTRYRTLAFKAKMTTPDGSYFEANIKKMDDPKSPPEVSSGNKTTYYYMNYVSNTGNVPENADSFYKSFKNKYGNKNSKYYNEVAMKKINDFFSQGGRMYLDSVGTVTVDGVAKGSVYENGEPVVTEPRTIYDNKDDFLRSAPWLASTRSTAPNMFNIKIDFPPQPVTDPIPHITKGKGTTDVTSVEYKEGEIIDLIGINSEFPKAVNREYEWNYKKKGTTIWTPCGNKATPDLTGLPVGEYEAKLDVQYTMSAFWGENGKITRRSISPAYCNIIIKPNDTIGAVTTIDAPSDVILKKTETQAVIPVTLTSTISNMPVDKISKVEYILATDNEGILFRESMPPSTSVAGKKTFNIFYKGTPFTQYFKGKTIYTLKSGKVVESLWAVDGTFIRQEGLDGMPPVPVLRPIPDMVMGSTVYLDGSQSYDPDGEVVKWDFYIPTWGYAYSEDGKKHTDIITKGLGNRIQAVLGVTDNEGNYAETEQFFKVTPPPPMLDIHVGGFLKENRKVDLMSNVTNISGFTTDDSQVTWTISPMGSEPESGIKAQTLTGKNISVLFKNKGSYLVECHAVNSANMSADQNITVNISEDSPPKMIIDAYDTVYRDEKKNATITAFDNSVSLDNDYISSRTWYYAFDSDNDGNFDDESKVFIKTATLPEDNSVSITASKVGKYKIYLEVKEGFGQPTIPIFISPQDYKVGSTDKIVEVNNYKPVVSFVPMTEKKVDLVVMTDYTGDKLTALGERLNKYVEESYDNYLNVSLRMATDSKYVGRYLNEDAMGWWYVQDSNLGKYPIATWSVGSSWSSVDADCHLTEYSDNTYEGAFKTTGVYTGNSKVTYSGSFPARIKQVGSVNNMSAILLENGDLYVAGVDSYCNRSVGYTSDFYKPTKIYSGVKAIVDQKDYNRMMFLLMDNGDVYVAGELPYIVKINQLFADYNNSFIDMRNLATSVLDYNSLAGYSFVSFAGGPHGFSKLNGLKDITYVRVTKGNIVARDKNGDWWGVGTSLNAFGHNTGFVDTKVNAYGDAAESQANWLSGGGWKAADIVTDAINEFVKMPNLSALDKAVGGITEVDPFTAYAKNGDIYTFKQTPHVQHGSDGWYVLYPFKILDDGVFEYAKTGVRDPNKHKSNQAPVYFTPSKNISDYSPDDSMIQRLKDLNIPTEWQGKESIRFSMMEPIPDPPAVSYRFYALPAYVTNGEINNYEQYSYLVEAKLVSFSTSEYHRKDDDYMIRNDVINYKVIGFKKESPSAYVTGWKFYGLDADKLPNTTFRPNAEKYVLYLGEKDSFQKVSPAIIDYVQKNNIKVKVATDSKYLDRRTDKTREVNLRDFITATPKGKAYDADGLETMLSDITSENQVMKPGQDGLYVIKGEDTVTYNSYFSDLEGDTKINEIYNHIHNSTYFENSEGQSAYHDIRRKTPVSVFDKVGLYNVFYRATDQPTTETQFQGYNRDSNTDETKIYVHRRPIADFDMKNIYNQTNLNFSVVSTSYDLDHKSYVDKGIKTAEWKWKRFNSTTWVSGLPNLTLNYGEKIEVYLEVTDYEGVSSSTQKTFTMPDEAPFEFGATLTAEKTEHTLTAFPRGNNVVWVNVWSIYPFSHHLETALYDSTGKNRLAPIKSIPYNEGITANAVANHRFNWINIPYLIPNTIANGNYKMIITAISNVDPSKTKSITENITVISNKAPTVKITKISPSDIYAGDDVNIKVMPNDEDGDKLTLDVYSRETGKAEVKIQSFYNVMPGVEFSLSQLKNVSYGSQTIRVVVTDPSGAQGMDSITFDAKAMLKNLRITKIYDVRAVKSNVGTIGVSNMPSTGFKAGGNTHWAKGYKFDFEIDSKGFVEATDEVIVTPSYYYTLDGVPAIRGSEVDLYYATSPSLKIYKAGEGPHSNYKTLNMYKVSNSGSSSTWKSTFLIPATSFMVPKGTGSTDAKAIYKSKSEIKANILVCFTIRGYKDGKVIFNYNTDQWGNELSNSILPFRIGDVIIYDRLKNSLDDQNVYRMW